MKHFVEFRTQFFTDWLQAYELCNYAVPASKTLSRGDYSYYQCCF